MWHRYAITQSALLGAFILGTGCATERQPAVAIEAGDTHTCALLESGKVRCWGLGEYGRLGLKNDDIVGDNESPSARSTVDLPSTATRVTAGHDHSCAVLLGGQASCWGRAEFGQLGYGNPNDIGDDEAPSSAGTITIGGNVTQLEAGGFHTCALLDTGNIRCWGDNTNGQLGYGSTDDIGDDELPSTAGDVDVGGEVTEIAVGFGHVCAIRSDRSLVCWGRGEPPLEDAYGGWGQLGYGNFDNIGDDELPVSAGPVDVGGDVYAITAGYGHTCALLEQGRVRCWGRDSGPRGFGQLGYAEHRNIGDDESPASAGDVDVGGTVTKLAAGEVHTCALLDTGAVRCWGFGGFGQLGYGNRDNIGDDEAPTVAGDIDLGGIAIDIAVGTWHSCALIDNGDVRCWGLGINGQLGYGDTTNIGDDEPPSMVDPVHL